MDYTCNCKPKQKLPHVIRSSSRVYQYLSWLHFGTNKSTTFYSITKYTSHSLSCDKKRVPVRKWKVYILGLSIRFGKFVV